MNPLEKEFAPYQESLELKELGFDEPCFGYFNTTSYLGIGSFVFKECDKRTIDGYGNKPLLRPTFSQAFRWFREKYGLYSWITIELGNKSTFCWVLSGEHTSTQYAAYFHTYEEAELACLRKLIEIVKDGNK